jgi:hypothetical protein
MNELPGSASAKLNRTVAVPTRGRGQRSPLGVARTAMKLRSKKVGVATAHRLRYIQTQVVHFWGFGLS